MTDTPRAYRCAKCGSTHGQRLGVCPICRAIGTLRAYAGEPRRHTMPKSPVPWWHRSAFDRPARGFGAGPRDPFEPEAVGDGHDAAPDVDSWPDDALHVSSTLNLPIEFATQTAAVLAKRGSGKTYFLNVLHEEFERLELPCVSIDPVGAMCGLAKALDGEDTNTVVFGGEHGLPLLDPAAAVAHVAEGGQTVFDLSTVRRDECIAWGVAFFESLFFYKSTHRSPLHLLVDEADLFAPQTASGEDVRTRCRLALEDIVRRGRLFGFGCTLATQRPSVLHKNVLSQTQILVALRMTSPQDREAIDEWVRANGDDDRRYAVMDSLATLSIGEAWVWSPGWEDLFDRVRIRPKRTLDSSRTPEVRRREG